MTSGSSTPISSWRWGLVLAISTNQSIRSRYSSPAASMASSISSSSPAGESSSSSSLMSSNGGGPGSSSISQSISSGLTVLPYAGTHCSFLGGGPSGDFGGGSSEAGLSSHWSGPFSGPIPFSRDFLLVAPKAVVLDDDVPDSFPALLILWPLPSDISFHCCPWRATCVEKTGDSFSVSSSSLNHIGTFPPSCSMSRLIFGLYKVDTLLRKVKYLW